MFPAWFPSLVLFGMPALIVGYGVGVAHIRHLAFNGGEERYPSPIPETVEAYRQKHRVDELQYVGAALVPFGAAVHTALSVLTLGVIGANVTIGYYFATMAIRRSADVERADEPQIFGSVGSVLNSKALSPEDIDSIDDWESIDDESVTRESSSDE